MRDSIPPVNKTPREALLQYGESCAAFYDEIYGQINPNVLSALIELARGGPVLELGIATGRVALALAAREIEVSGIETSPAMISKLLEKPESSKVRVVQGDFAHTLLPDKFQLVFALVNTFFLLTSRLAQEQCLQNCARMLSNEGALLLECYKPLDAPSENGDGKLYRLSHIVETRNGPRRYEANLLYREPRELDEMARAAGLSLKARWSTWQKQPFAPGGLAHISLYGHRNETTISSQFGSLTICG
jgi:SAM-dependent methyltransferase